MSFEKIKAQVQEHANILPEIKRLQEHITNLESRNAELELENRRLREILDSRQNERSTDTPVASTKVVQSTLGHSNGKSSANMSTSAPNATIPVAGLGTESSAWAMVARKAAHKKPTPKRRTVESAARGFQPITGPVGFGYVYIPRSRRMSRRDVRSRLSVLGIDPYRVLDITFPARSVVGLLVHEQYKDVLLTQLGKAKIEVYQDFNPCDPVHLADPTYKDKSNAERLAIAMDIHRNRCCRGIARLRHPIAVAVGRTFLEEGFITDEDLQEALVSSTTATYNSDIYSTPLTTSAPSSYGSFGSSGSPGSPGSPGSHGQAISSPSSLPLTINLWNANGLQATTVDDLLRHCQSFSLIFITETWLLPPNKIRTPWPQFHLYGTPVDGNFRGSQGVSALVSPSFPLSVMQFPVHTKYTLGLQVGRSLRLICLYLPPSLTDDEVSAALDVLPLTQDTIICGDLNTRLGAVTGDSRSNTRGPLLRDWVEERGLSILNSSLAHGVPTYLSYRNGRVMSSIVDYFITNLPCLNRPQLQVYTDLSLGSDHKLMSLSFEYSVPVDQPIQSTPSASARRLWNLSRLQEPDVLKLYVDSFRSFSAALVDQLQQLCSSPPDSTPPIDRLNDELNAAIYGALNKTRRCP
ncbi:hypothetical protein G6F45_012286 [Rhizopus arrhizus]|nr:hypothetical protein G6F45_012286 [Rhizopus arrhizus]